jgi:hypothetical protein
MGIVVIACYRPKSGQGDALLDEVRRHWEILDGQGLVTDRTPVIVQAADGTIVEVFEWLSQHAVDQAHTNPVVLEMWGRYAALCDYVPIGDLPEAAKMFSEFLPV